MDARRTLRMLAVQPAANPSAQAVYSLVLRATGSKRAAEKSMAEMIAAELRAGRTPNVQ